MLKRFSSLCFCVILAFGVAVACSSDGGKLSQQLNGKWTNDMGTVTFDVANGTYSGILMGQKIDNKIKVVEETADYLVIEVTNPDGKSYKATAQFKDDGSMALTKEGSPMSMVLKPAK